jgi:dihydroflavonol-4-reductase
MILITGATGLVGGNLIWHLLQENDRVVAIRRTTSNLEPLRTIFSYYTPTPELYLARIDWKIADILDEKAIHVAMQGISIVYHCAAVVSFNKMTENISDTNITGTRNIVCSALENKIDKLCFVSSIAACGKAFAGNQIDESSIWTDNQNHSVYSKSKYYSEKEVWKGIKQGLHAVIVNPGVVLGISGTNTGSSQLFLQVQKGLLFYTNGGSGYVDVRDVVTAMIQLTKSEITAQRFILVGDNCSNKDILGWISDGFEKRHPVIPLGKTMLLIVGCLLEMTGWMFHFYPILDRGIARTISHREYYSNRKICSAIGIRFNPIKQCILDICDFRIKKGN